jgi:4-aminobutyrate aminotransferase
MIGNEFTTPDGRPDTETAVRAQRAAAERGLLLLTCGAFGNVVRMIPPLVVQAEHIDEAEAIWAASVRAAQER